MCPSRFSAMGVVRHVRLTFFGGSVGPQAIRAFKSSVARRFVSWSRDCKRNNQSSAELRTPLSPGDSSTRSNKSTSDSCDVPHVLKQLTRQSAFNRAPFTPVSADPSLGMEPRLHWCHRHSKTRSITQGLTSYCPAKGAFKAFSAASFPSARITASAVLRLSSAITTRHMSAMRCTPHLSLGRRPARPPGG
jgi:hypothetical protein